MFKGRSAPNLAEGLLRIERGLGIDAGLDEIALDLARCGREIVGGEGCRDIDRGHAARGHPVRIEPHPHREGLATENLRIGDPIDRLQSRLNHAVQVIGDLRWGKNLRIEGHVKNGG